MISSSFFVALLMRPDYVCRMTPKAKDKLCKLVFSQQDFVARYNIQYGNKLDKSGYDFNFKLVAFSCFLNTIFNLGLSQEMLRCPLVNSENGNVVINYYLSTNYTPNQVIVFEAGDDGRVFAVVAVYDLDLHKLHTHRTNKSG